MADIARTVRARSGERRWMSAERARWVGVTSRLECARATRAPPPPPRGPRGVYAIRHHTAPPLLFIQIYVTLIRNCRNRNCLNMSLFWPDHLKKTCVHCAVRNANVNASGLVRVIRIALAPVSLLPADKRLGYYEHVLTITGTVAAQASISNCCQCSTVRSQVLSANYGHTYPLLNLNMFSYEDDFWVIYCLFILW